MFLQILLLLIAIPIGFLIKYLTPEELKSGQKYFKAIIIVSIIAGVFFFIEEETYITWTSAFIVIVALISLKKKK